MVLGNRRKASLARLPTAGLIVCLLSTSAGPALGQSGDARAQFSRGVEAYGKGHYEAALDAFKASYRIRAVPVVLFNIAETYTALDRFDDAMTYLNLYSEGIPQDTLDAAQREQLSQLQQRIRKATGTLRILEAPEGATVLVDGKDQSAAALRPVYVAVGQHTLAVTHPDHGPWRRSVQVDPGESEVLRVELVPRPRDATLRVVVAPQDASVLIDGGTPSSPTRERGGVVFNLRPGWHEVSLRKPGMTSVDTVLELRAGETREVSAELLKGSPPSALRSPWLWGGVGLFVGAFVGYQLAR
jgi:hypothetical protein